MIKRLAAAICLALLAAAIPEIRDALLDHIGAADFLRRDVSKGSFHSATFD